MQDLLSQLRASVGLVTGAARTAVVSGGPKPFPTKKMNLTKALAEFLSAKANRVSFHQLDALKVRNTHLVNYCVGRELLYVHEVTPAVCDAWLKAKDVSPRTQRGYLGDISSFLNWCTKYPRQWLIENPVSVLEKPRARNGIPTTIPVAIAREFMDYLEKSHPDLVAFYALALFAGVRPDKRDGEIKRLADDIARDGWDRYITHRMVTIPRPKVGNARNFPLKGNLRMWLTHYPRLVVPTQWQHQCLAKKFKLTANVLRHTAISAYVTVNGSMAEASVAFGNSETMIRRHYLNIMSKADAVAFYGIKPKQKLQPLPAEAASNVGKLKRRAP